MYQVPEEIQSRSGVDTDADRVRGIIIASSFLEVANKPANLRKIGAVASIIGVGQLIFEGATIENADWENETNWKQYGGGTVEICDQSDVEQAEPTENTKATSALRAWQGYVYWCKNTLFPELNTSDKTIVGSVNETYELAKNGSAVGGYANNLYFDETASDVVGYETLSYTPTALETTEVWTVNAVEGVKIFKNYLYPSAVSVGFIPAGQWSFQFWGNVSSSAGITKLGATYFKRSALGIETDLLTIWSSEIDNTTPDWIKFSLTFPNFTVDPTDRMGCRVIGQTTHNSDITITYVVGDGYGAWLNNPNRVRHTQLRDFNGDSTVQHIDNSTVKATPIDADKVALWDSVAGKMVTATISSIKAFFSLIFRLKTEIGDAHGFTNPPNANNFTVSNTGASVTLNLLANAGNYKINGTEYTNAGLSRTFTASLGQNFLCIDSTGLIVSPLDIMNLTKIPCATIKWDGTKAIVGDELHTADRNLIQHKKEHDTDGARYVNGFATTFGAGAANTFSAATGIVRDEERYHTIGARTQAMICYRNVAGTAMLYDAPSTNYAKVIGGLPQYDNAGVQTALGANNYGIMWMYVTNNKLPTNSEIVFVQGQAAYASVGAAQAAPIPTLAGMSVAEWKLAYRVIIRRVANALVFIQADDYRLVAGGLAVNGGGLTSINAANVICTAPTGYTATDQQSLDNDLAANTIKGATATKATIVDADTIGVWDSVGNAFKKASALAFKTYIKLGLKASEILNDSLNVLGITLKDVLDNATLAIDAVTIQDADLFPIAREVEAPAGVFTSVNMYHTWDRIKSEIKTNSGVRFVANETDLNSALQAEVDSMCIVVTEPITSSMSNIYPKNIHISGYDITIPDGVWLLNGTSADAEFNIYFDNTINIAKSTSDGTCRIVSVDTKVWNITFRNLQYERGVILSQLGATGGEIHITTTRIQDINIATSQGTRTVTIKNTLDNTGFYYRGFSQQGYNQVYSEITDAGNFTVKAHLTFQKDEVGSIILMPSNANIMLHPSKFTITYISSDLANAGNTIIYGSLDFPRFDGEGEQVTFTTQLDEKGERYIYIVPDGYGSVDYNHSTERAVMLQNGNWVLNYTGSALGATQQNRLWYSIIITGHADTTSGNWISI